MTKKVSDLDVEFAFQTHGVWLGAFSAFVLAYVLASVAWLSEAPRFAQLGCGACAVVSWWQSRRCQRRYRELRRIRSEQAMKDLDEAHDAQRKDLAQMQAKLAERFFGGLN